MAIEGDTMGKSVRERSKKPELNKRHKPGKLKKWPYVLGAVLRSQGSTNRVQSLRVTLSGLRMSVGHHFKANQ